MMKMRKLPAAILAAAAGLVATTGAAQAETSVTLYGIVDLGIGYQKIRGQGTDVSRTGMIDGQQSGSRWGLRGSEDLGNGTRAIFQLESGFNSRTGRSRQGDRLFGRQATIGLANDAWGQVTAGRQVNISSLFFSSIDPMGASYHQASLGSVFSSTETLRWDNLIQYLSPSIGGFQAGVGYSFDTGEAGNVGDLAGDNTFATNNKNRAITGGLRYANGPLNVAATADYLNPASNNGADGSKGPIRIFSWQVGGTYDFEVVKLALAYGQIEDGWFGSAGVQSGQGFGGPGSNYFNGTDGTDRSVNGFKAKSYMVGLSAPVGPGSLFGSWQRADPSNDRLTGDDKTMNIYSLGYTYDLSKRTNLYAYGSYAKNWAFLDGYKSTAAGVGVRHRF